ncbi:MAG: MARTX multifunctional-autoprocessing repeats-in-toxin holotoxin RtxA [Photobacterium frigidiphilum]|uniref:MARTX multifunctional-autoprocessing repeats-in-toxin holotoxin RtxA n=1 Tax=Photobacterium frigidiphilum TaxID=264736 RepID=UPI003001483A
MGKPFWRSVEYFFTGNYSADNGNNNIVAIGFGGKIHAYGGDDTITVGSIGITVYTGSGNDTVQGGGAYLKIEDTSGNLNVKGAAGYAGINKSEDGHVSFAGLAGGVSIDHTGNHGNVKYDGLAAYNDLTRKGLTGNVIFEGTGGYNKLWHETNHGNLYFFGAGAGNKLVRTWFNRYQGSQGDVTFNGVGAANSISSQVETGNISFKGAGADNHLVRKGKVGNITLQGAGASNRIERTRQVEDTYTETRGNIRFEGVGGYNSIYSDVAHGNINFSGGGAYNKITRKGANNDFESEGLTNAKADDIVLTTAMMSGSWIGKSELVTAIKSTREPNTYLFAFPYGNCTKINKVQLCNDPQTGQLKYYSTAWYKKGNYLKNLANQDISLHGGFNAANVNGAYTLSDLTVEHQQPVTIHAIEKNLTEYQWVTYANGALIDAADVTLLDAKMGGSAIAADGLTVDVLAVKSTRKPNTYIYASLQGPYTKIVVVELANDALTGVLKYSAIPWYKTGDYTASLANEDISVANGYRHGGCSLGDLQYSVNVVRSSSERVADIDEYSEQALIHTGTNSGKSTGDVRFNGVGGGNVIKSNVTHGNVYFNGGGIANVILHSSKFGNTEFNGGGAANVIVKSGQKGDLTFRGIGLANVLVHQSKQGKMDVYAGGAVNVLVRIGDGQYLAHMLAYGNVSVHKGNGDSRVVMLGGYNTHTQIGNGNGTWLAAGGFNVMTKVGTGNIISVLAGGTNVLTKIGDGDLISGMIGSANVITHISSDRVSSYTTGVALGGANILTKKGKGDVLAVMGGGANVLTHIGDGTTTGVMVGGANILTKVGTGDTTGIMLGLGNVLTHIGDGQTLGVMGAVGNIFTKVGEGTSIAAMIGAANIFTHIGEGDAWALMGGVANVFTKVGNGNALALMVAEANVFTHVGDGLSVALMLAKGNIATKVGNGMTLAAMVGNANIFTHIGDGTTFTAMIGQANIMTKVGDELTAALMVGKANIYTHVGNGTSIGMFAGELNVMTKVGSGTTLAAMFGKANIMTHVGDGLTGVLALGEANIVTKVGDGFMGVVAAAKANVITHVGDATTAAVLAGKGNILTKVGKGTTVGLLISDIGNVMTHIGDGTTIGFTKGKANIITKVGDGLGINAGWGKANVFTQIGDGDRYNFAKGEANVITKVGDGQEVAVVHGKANIITHVGDGDNYTGAWGKNNIITKVGDGRSVVLAKGEANIVTQVGKGDGFNALWGKANIVTKVGDGIQVTAAEGKANIVTTVGNGLSVTAMYGDLNINTKVGDGISVNVAWGKYNINTKVGDGLNVAVMKGKANVNIHVGDGMGINASYAQNNVAIKIGNGDFYSLAVASSNTNSNKLSALFDSIKQTVLGVGGSQAINYLMQGNDGSSSGTRKGRGAITTPEVTKLDGFQLDEIEEVGTDLGESLSGGVTDVETPDMDQMQDELDVKEAPNLAQSPNLIVNGDFEQSGDGWDATHGIEASYSASVYGVDGVGHGSHVSELDTYINTSLSQDLTNLSDGEVISLNFDFAKRVGISNNEGMEVIWNGNVVFSTSGDETTWQQQTLKLTAQAGNNRIEFKGTGRNDGLGYVLDNVVAKSETSQQTNAVSKHAEQNKAAQNATADKERAEADSQRLKQEKDQQLAALSGSQSQLESTDQEVLKNNGQAQRDAVNEESEAITKKLTSMTKGLDALDGNVDYKGEVGDYWCEHFAGGILDDVQGLLDQSKAKTEQHLAKSQQQIADRQQGVKNSVAKSEVSVKKGEQNQSDAERGISDAKSKAESRKAEALSHESRAKQAGRNAHSASSDAQNRGASEIYAANSKASQAQIDGKGAKQEEGKRTDREGAAGSGLSGKAYDVQAASGTASYVDAEEKTQADGRFSDGLTDDEQEALEGATQAVNRLQVNAGIRASNSGSSITAALSKADVDRINVSKATQSHEVLRKEIQGSGVSLEGLGEAASDSASKVDSASQDKPKTVLMSVADLLESAYVKGKTRGKSYQKVIDALANYHAISQVNVDSKLDAMVNLRKQVEGYVLGHPDSQRVQGLKTLLEQVNVRVEEMSTLVESAIVVSNQDSFSRLYDQLNNANLKPGKHQKDNAEQKGALAWEIDSRALKVIFQPKAEKYNRLFRDVASAGVADNKAREQQAPQLLLLNLSNDGFGGRCDPLSKLVLVAKQLENDGQEGVARKLLEKMYSAAAVLSKPDLYSDTERANADKLLGSLAALHAKNPMHDTLSKVWKEKLEDDKALTVNAIVEKVTEPVADGKPVLLELDGPDHAMAAWAKGSGENRVYGFYDPNVGIVEFSSAEKFSAYVTRFFGQSDINMAQRYKLPKNQFGEVVFSRVVVMDGNVLSKYKPTPSNKITMQDILGLPVFQYDYKSRDLVIKPLKHQESIELGMPETDQKVMADIADRENVIIAVRPVDEKSKSLIDSKMYSSKGLFVKAKSSDWGPMSGFIPVVQSFAKASARRDLAKFNGYAEQSIKSGNAVSTDLYLNQARVDDLVSKYNSLTRLELDAESGMHKTTATDGEKTVPFFLNKVVVDSKELWQVHYMKDGELAPFKVIGDPVSKQPMTADYDLLTVMYPYSDLGPKDKVKQPLEWEHWKESVTYEDLRPKFKELYDNEALYNKKDGASLGIVSDRLKELKDVINTSLGRTNGLEMVHHGADDANPYAVMADNFPATFFVPKSFFTEDGLGEGKGSIQTYFNVNEQGAVVILNPQEFSNFQQVAINASYRAPLNDKWNEGLDQPLFTKKRKLSYNFLDAKDKLTEKLTGEVGVDSNQSGLESLGPKRRPRLKLNIDTSMTPWERRKAEYQKQGILVASGFFGLVIRDPNDSKGLLKYVGQAYETAKVESRFFNQFYGEESSEVYRHVDGDVFLKMLKVPGVPVADLSAENMPKNGKELFLKMVSDLSEAHIYHRDLHLGNVMYDTENKRFWPINFESAVDLNSNEYLKNYQADAEMFEKSLQYLTKEKFEKLNGINTIVNNHDVDLWKLVAVTAKVDGGTTRFDGQIIIQTENDPIAAKAAANLAGKHPESSVVVQLGVDGKYRVVYGDPSQLSGKLRWQVVGHGRDDSENHNSRLSGYSATELATKLAQFNQDFSQFENIISKPDHISLVGCSLVSYDKQNGFAQGFITSMAENGIRSDVSARRTNVAVNSKTGRKYTFNTYGQWEQKISDNKVVLSWNEQGKVVVHKEAIRNGVTEGDIDLALIGLSKGDAPVHGAIADNDITFIAPEKRKNVIETSSSSSNSNQLSYSGNIQVNVGDGEFTAVNWGTSNVAIKVGTGGFKSLAFGDNNVMVHIGNGDSQHSFDIGGYQALEGVQMFIGNRNVSFNMGRSNDLIVMMDKSLPTPPLVNPFNGASRISGVLQGIAGSRKKQDWLADQDEQWTLSGAKKFVKDMSGLDQTSSVDYTTLVDLDSQNERSSRGLKSDTEATLNKHYNKWLSGNNADTSKMSRSDKFRQANEKLAFNFAVGGQGADIQITTGNWNFMFGDNIQSILDTNLGSLFGLMTQQFSSSGQVGTTFTYNPQDLPRQLKNKLLGKLAGVGADTTLADIFAVDYTANGHIVARNGEAVDGVSILTEVLEVIAEFGGDQLQSFTDPSKLLDSLKSSLDMGDDAINSFAESHGLKEKAPEEQEDKSTISVNAKAASQAASNPTEKASEKADRAFGFNALNLPNLFSTIFSKDKQTEMKSLVTSLKQNLTADLLNMEEKTFDFLRDSGHLQGDGDVNVSLGNYNFNWGGDGKDLGAYLGDNNNFWGGRGDDVYYAIGTSNIFTGGEGNDFGVLMGRENIMFGGDGNDTAVVAGRINHVYMGAGNDQSFVFGEGGEIKTGTGQDYIVTSGNFNRVDAGDDQDYSVTIGNNNQIELGSGNDFAKVFGNYNRINGNTGNDVVKLMGYHAVLKGGEGDDHLIAAALSKFSQFDGGEGRDLIVLGGYQNTFYGGSDIDSFVVSGDIIDNLVEDIRNEDNIVFNGINWQNLWFERSGYDLKLSILRDGSADSAQKQFESVGAVTFADYFNGNRAELIIGMGDKDAYGVREYTALSDNAVDVLIQAMSSFTPTAGDNGFIDNLNSKSRVAMATAWADVTNGKAVLLS